MSGFLVDEENEIKIFHVTNVSVMNHSHVHPQYELFFCSENVAQKSIINGVEYNYTHPCVIISTPYTVHANSCEDPDAKTFDRFVFSFAAKTIEAFPPHIIPENLKWKNSGLFFKLTKEQADHLKSLLLSVDAQTVSEKELVLALFLNRLLRIFPIEQVERIGTSSFYIQDVLQYISENYFQPIDASSIARHFAISRSKLDRDFKRFTGVTVHDYIESCRSNQAKFLLEFRENISIRDVAKMCGFNSETYFFPFFKKHVGVTPIEYRKNKQRADGELKQNTKSRR